MQNSVTNVRKLTGTAMLGAVAAVLMYLEFPHSHHAVLCQAGCL